MKYSEKQIQFLKKEAKIELIIIKKIFFFMSRKVTYLYMLIEEIINVIIITNLSVIYKRYNNKKQFFNNYT